MSSHLSIVAMILAAYSLLQLVVAALIGAVFALAGAGIGVAGMSAGEEELMAVAAVYSVVGVGVAALVAMVSIPGFAAAWGVYRRRPWGRMLGMVMAALVCTNFPLGTLLGVYALYVLFDAESAAAFTADAG